MDKSTSSGSGPTAVGPRIWFSVVFFGLIGQIAWIVENMYFATFAQDIFANSGRADLSFLVTTLMVILSAITATLTTVVAGGLCDRAGRRKPFIAYGYIAWGFTIMLFALLPMRVSERGVAAAAALLVVFDCVMTVAGSTSNDAAFNAWVADNTDPSNRGRVNSVLSVLPVFAVVIVFIGLGGLYSADNASNSLFFIVLGIIPTAAGILALFTLRDSPRVHKSAGEGVFTDFLYGFSPAVVKSNPILYICLCAACLIGIAQQTFFSYLINFLRITLGLGDGFVVPMAIIIVGSAVLTGIVGVLSDRFGRKRFYFPMLFIAVAGILSFWLLQYVGGALRTVVIYAGGTLMMGGILSLTGSFMSTFQDHIPAGYEGRYQGVRMCFNVLVPMIIGPVISLLLGLNAMGMNGADFVPPYSIFLAGAIVAALAAVPVIYVKKDAAGDKKC
ncbi:MAG: MFS transporter [Oscillospiraceae bacterium]|nr:MFS transporter [Oscillospiraceae bacterium]